MRDMILKRFRAAGIEITPEQAADFETYHRMLCAANASFNLTRIPDEPAEAIDRNYLDCAMPLKYGLLDGVETMIDVGSGAGFPGLPLAILRRDIHIVLLDSLTKRVDFLQSVINTLHLNAEAVHMRAEDAARKPELREQFDMATARAVASLNLLSEYLLPFVKVGGHMLALKGPSLEEELSGAAHAFEVLGGQPVRTIDAEMPGRDWSHKLCMIQKVSPTPERYPRRAGKPEKNPL